MQKQARVEPVFDSSDLKEKITGWVVIDESQPDNENVVSEHATQEEALRAAEQFEQARHRILDAIWIVVLAPHQGDTAQPLSPIPGSPL